MFLDDIPLNFHDQLISPRPSAADRSRPSQVSEEFATADAFHDLGIRDNRGITFLGGIYRYINKQIHIYIIIYKYSKPYSCNT